MNNINIGFKIKHLRERKNWSQLELADKVGINNSVLSRIESGKRDVESELLTKFADVFDVTTDFLLGRENEAVVEEEIPHGLDPNLVDALKKASPEHRKRALDYLAGKVETPVIYSDTEKQFLNEIDHLTPEDLMKRYTLRIGERDATPEEIQEAIDYIKAKRIMKLME